MSIEIHYPYKTACKAGMTEEGILYIEGLYILSPNSEVKFGWYINPDQRKQADVYTPFSWSEVSEHAINVTERQWNETISESIRVPNKGDVDIVRFFRDIQGPLLNETIIKVT